MSEPIITMFWMENRTGGYSSASKGITLYNVTFVLYKRRNIQEPKWERVCKMRSCKIAEFQGNEQTQYVEYKRKYSGVIWMTILVGRSMKVNCGRFFFYDICWSLWCCFKGFMALVSGPDDMPAHIKSSMFGCALTYVFQSAFPWIIIVS